MPNAPQPAEVHLAPPADPAAPDSSGVVEAVHAIAFAAPADAVRSRGFEPRSSRRAVAPVDAGEIGRSWMDRPGAGIGSRGLNPFEDNSVIAGMDREARHTRTTRGRADGGRSAARDVFVMAPAMVNIDGTPPGDDEFSRWVPADVLREGPEGSESPFEPEFVHSAIAATIGFDPVNADFREAVTPELRDSAGPDALRTAGLSTGLPRLGSGGFPSVRAGVRPGIGGPLGRGRVNSATAAAVAEYARHQEYMAAVRGALDSATDRADREWRAAFAEAREAVFAKHRAEDARSRALSNLDAAQKAWASESPSPYAQENLESAESRFLEALRELAEVEKAEGQATKRRNDTRARRRQAPRGTPQKGPLGDSRC